MDVLSSASALKRIFLFTFNSRFDNWNKKLIFWNKINTVKNTIIKRKIPD